jgi:hypothetical protein
MLFWDDGSDTPTGEKRIATYTGPNRIGFLLLLHDKQNNLPKHWAKKAHHKYQLHNIPSQIFRQCECPNCNSLMRTCSVLLCQDVNHMI